MAKICPYAPNDKCIIVDRTDSNKTKTTIRFRAQDCLGNRCPFYSDGTGDYMEGACIRVQRELED